ncbi:MAG: hypothetical protein ACREKS_13075 [Candidatus Rokuibacteriota bacterium]
MDALKAIARGSRAAIRARPGLFVAVTGTMVALSIVLPPLVLSVARKPWTYFTFNPWLKSLPSYLASETRWSEKLDFLSRVALFWFSADGPYGAPEWGFAVDTMDLARIMVTAVLVAAYFTLWVYLRGHRQVGDWQASTHHGGGTLGTVVGLLGLSTGPCSVIGCGAPVLPVVGLAVAGLSSGTLALLSGVSRVLTVMVMIGLAVGVASLGAEAGRLKPRPRS